MTGTDRVEATLVRFADAAMTGHLDEARAAFADAQARGLEQVRLSAHVWVAQERQLAESLPDRAGRARAERLLVQARRRAPVPSRQALTHTRLLAGLDYSAPDEADT